MQEYARLKPIKKGSIALNAGVLNVAHDGVEYEIHDLPIDGKNALDLIVGFDGETTIETLLGRNPGVSMEDAVHIVDSFYHSGLLDKNLEPDYVTGLEFLLEVEDLQNKLMYETLYQNVFWQNCQDPDSVPKNVFYGMAIENYHFLFRESWFDSPILGFPMSIRARVLMNEFFCEEYGHDELILNSLNTIGITREQIYKTVPLPETLALCNSLAYWSASDPIFFFTTMGVLEGKDLKIDSYVSAMEDSSAIDDSFIEFIRHHSNINLNDGHGNLSREIFKKLPAISRQDADRMKRQSHLFIEIYDRFYTAIWNHYSNTDQLLRIV